MILSFPLFPFHAIISSSYLPKYDIRIKFLLMNFLKKIVKYFELFRLNTSNINQSKGGNL